MFTINKLNNLINYWLLMQSNSISSHLNDDISYIQEKYNLFFTEKLTYDVSMKILINSEDYMYEELIRFTNKWNLSYDDFILTDNFGVLLIAIIFSHLQSTWSSKTLLFNLCNEYKKIKHYTDITENDTTYILHDILKPYKNKIYNENKIFYRNVYINSINKKISI